jgi:hypothetical protein
MIRVISENYSKTPLMGSVIYEPAAINKPLVFSDPGGFSKGDRKKQRADDAHKNKDIGHTFHGAESS